MVITRPLDSQKQLIVITIIRTHPLLITKIAATWMHKRWTKFSNKQGLRSKLPGECYSLDTISYLTFIEFESGGPSTEHVALHQSWNKQKIPYRCTHRTWIATELHSISAYSRHLTACKNRNYFILTRYCSGCSKQWFSLGHAPHPLWVWAPHLDPSQKTTLIIGWSIDTNHAVLHA